MFKFIAKPLALGILSMLAISFSSCKDDEDSGPNQLSFSEEEMTVEESGTVQVELVLAKPASQDLTIKYDVAGEAIETEDVTIGLVADYEIDGDAGEIVIPKGQQTAVIELDIVNDGTFEADETIEFTIDDVSDPELIVTNNDQVVITIENDDAVVQASFAESTSETTEDGELIEVTVQIDRIAEEPITLNYELSGTSLDSLTAWELGQEDETTYAYDYYIDGVTREVVIPAGSSTGKIRLQAVSDRFLEDDATAIITLVPTTGVTVSATASEHTVDILQEDGKIIWLQWPGEYTTVDMDLFHWIKEDGEYGLINLSLNPSFDGEEGEYSFWPTAFGGGEFGMSYNYYEGDEDPMDFTAKFIDFTDGVALLADSITFPGRYTAVNINKWDDEVNGILPPPIAQTYTVTDGDYEINNIIAPNEGSRSSTRFSKNVAWPNRNAKQLKKNLRQLRMLK